MEQSSGSKNSAKSAKKPSFREKSQRIRAKLLSSYYGNPIKDMKLVAVTGSTGKATVAHFIHEILRASGQHVAVLASDSEIKVRTLHKFLSDAWKAGSNYVVVTAPAESLKANVFYNLPVHVAVMTNFIPSGLNDMSAEEFSMAESTLFRMEPEIVVLNEDDANFGEFAQFTGKSQTISYGTARSATLRIDSAKLYKKGTEANLSLGSSRFSVASFLTGEPVVSYMAAAAAVATALNIGTDAISDGLANYTEEGA